MKIRNLDTFYWIASLGSFRAAAEKLNLTQPAISARIQVLENDLGVEVFLREVRNAELTRLGLILCDYAERQMKLEQDILSAFSDTTSIERTIRLGASETIVATWLPDFLTHLRTSYRGLSFELSVDATDNLRNALVGREIDLAFLMGPVAEVSITNQEICSYEMTFTATPDMASQRAEWTVADIAGQPILTFAGNTKPNRQIRELLSPHASMGLEMTTSTTLGALIRLAKSGLGICAIPKSVIAAERESGNLVELASAVELPPISFTSSFVSGSASSALLADICGAASAFLAPHLINNIYQN